MGSRSRGYVRGGGSYRNEEEEEEPYEEPLQRNRMGAEERYAYGRRQVKPHDVFGGFPAINGVQCGSGCMGCCCPCFTYGQVINSMADHDEYRQGVIKERPNTYSEILKPSLPCMAFGCTCIAAMVGIQGWGVPFLSSSGWGSMMLGNVLEAKTLLNIVGYCIPQCMFALPVRRAVMAETDETCTTSCCNVMVCPGCSLANLNTWSIETEYETEMHSCGSLLPCCIVVRRGAAGEEQEEEG